MGSQAVHSRKEKLVFLALLNAIGQFTKHFYISFIFTGHILGYKSKQYAKYTLFIDVREY